MGQEREAYSYFHQNEQIAAQQSKRRMEQAAKDNQLSRDIIGETQNTLNRLRAATKERESRRARLQAGLKEVSNRKPAKARMR